MGLEIFTTDEKAEHQLFGIRSVITCGVMTTWALQKMRSVDAGFNSWWAPLSAEMRGDPLCRYFWELRAMLEHEGMPHPILATLEFVGWAHEIVATAEVVVDTDTWGVSVDSTLNGGNLNRGPINRTAAQGARYSRLTNFRLPSPPRRHKGQELLSDRFDALAYAYLFHLSRRVVDPAVERWGEVG